MTDGALLPAGAVEMARILVVDDQALNRMMIKAILTNAGFRHLSFATDGRQALDMANLEPVDCILLDVMMPEVDGWTVCRELRNNPRFRRTPIIMQTALSRTQDRHQAFDLGATDFVTKPLDPKELVARIRVHVAQELLASRLIAYRARIDAELAEAREITEALLPDPHTLGELAALGLRFDCHHRPSSAVGGDYWNAWATREGKVAWFIADVSGHGVSAALRACVLHSLVMPPPPFSDDPARLVNHLDDRLYRHRQQAGYFVAGAVALFDPATATLAYVGAGLRDGLILRADGTIEPLPLSGLPLGVVRQIARPVRRVELGPGDTVLIHTDALVESHGLAGAPQSEEELRLWVAGVVAGAAVRTGLASLVAARFAADFGEALADDLLIVAARVGVRSTPR